MAEVQTNDTLQIRIPTGHLRALLTEMGALARLESFACEKIAEELIRKAPRAIPDAASIRATAEREANRIIDGKMRDLSNKWSLPEGVKAILREEVGRVVDAQVKTAIDTAIVAVKRGLAADLAHTVEEAERKLRDLTAKQRAEFAGHMEARMREIARSSFLDVLHEAREGLA